MTGLNGIGAGGAMEGQQTASSSSPPRSPPSTTHGRRRGLPAPLLSKFLLSSGSSPPHQTVKKTQELKLKVEHGESFILTLSRIFGNFHLPLLRNNTITVCNKVWWCDGVAVWWCVSFSPHQISKSHLLLLSPPSPH